MIFLEIILMALVVFGAYLWSKVSRINKVDLEESKIEVNSEVVAASEDISDVVNVALFGLDSRTGMLESGVNADTMIVASINPHTKSINMASLYRDTYMDIGGGQFRKANAAYSLGGAEGAISMMNRSMDLDLKKYIAVDFAALAKTIDLLGGLDLELTAEEAEWMDRYVWETAQVIGEDPKQHLLNPWVEDYYDVTYWSGGFYHVDGIQATAFCRIRYTTGDDFKRTERQRMVLELIFEKAKTMDIGTLNEMADQVFPMIQTNMTLTEMVSIGSAIIQYNFGDSLGLPIEKTTGNAGELGSCVVATDWSADISEFHGLIFGETGYVPSSTVQNMSKQMQDLLYSYEFESDDGDYYYRESGSEDDSQDSGESYYDEEEWDYLNDGDYDSSNTGYDSGEEYDDYSDNEEYY